MHRSTQTLPSSSAPTPLIEAEISGGIEFRNKFLRTAGEKDPVADLMQRLSRGEVKNFRSELEQLGEVDCAEAIRQRGVLYFESGKTDFAEKTLAAAATYAKGLTDLRDNLLHSIARTQIAIFDLEGAKQTIKLINVEGTIGVTIGIDLAAHALLELGVAEYTRGGLAEGQTCFRRAMQLYSEHIQQQQYGDLVADLQTPADYERERKAIYRIAQLAVEGSADLAREEIRHHFALRSYERREAKQAYYARRDNA